MKYQVGRAARSTLGGVCFEVSEVTDSGQSVEPRVIKEFTAIYPDRPESIAKAENAAIEYCRMMNLSEMKVS